MKSAPDILEYIEAIFQNATRRPHLYARGALALEDKLHTFDRLRCFILESHPMGDEVSYSAFLCSQGLRNKTFLDSFVEERTLDGGPPPTESEMMDAFREMWRNFLKWRVKRQTA